MRIRRTVLALIILYSTVTASWSIGNIFGSVQTRISPDRSDRFLNYTQNGHVNSTTIEVDTSSIIAAPHRNKQSTCGPGERRDRHGRCRKIW
ncbi:hypothetical protein WN55_02693 [Dufourea novaeangliae]|uniref:Uncharacterized protein n=1 Tax=Dufourea novaeangliae TaxID=178035 RepID=A0A154NXQ3_DUFNO|nr:hypothetical protein WN55_02693 [Dufourea novaeangliae]